MPYYIRCVVFYRTNISRVGCRLFPKTFIEFLDFLRRVEEISSVLLLHFHPHPVKVRIVGLKYRTELLFAKYFGPFWTSGRELIRGATLVIFCFFGRTHVPDSLPGRVPFGSSAYSTMKKSAHFALYSDVFFHVTSICCEFFSCLTSGFCLKL